MTYTGIFILIILIHTLADFSLQTHKQSQKKSESNLALLQHVATYSLVWYIALIAISHPTTAGDLVFLLAYTGIFVGLPHFCVDYFSSRLSRVFFEKEEYHDGFVVIGFDQMLHLIMLWVAITQIIIIN